MDEASSLGFRANRHVSAPAPAPAPVLDRLFVWVSMYPPGMLIMREFGSIEF
ncbi:hypothetical protein I546_7027 [Mycobacterium kansasii 732]|nr:hypothetical protein I546_7027 [Mycobacterium kansasii 732]